MTDEAVLLPVIPAANASWSDSTAVFTLATRGGPRLTKVLSARDGHLVVRDVAAPPAKDLHPIAHLRPIDGESRDFAVALVPADRELRVSGQPILGVKVLHPGDVLSTPHGDYLVTRRFRSSVGPAPEELAEKACGVCGMPLRLATIARCSCGCGYHEEPSSADASGDSDRLSCFSDTRFCLACQRQKTLDEQFLPSPEELGFRRES